MYRESTSCYLDGRYFNIVLSPLYKGIISKPLIINLATNEDQAVTHIVVEDLPELRSPKSVTPIVARVVIQSMHIRHSALLIIDNRRNQCWFWNPKVRYSHPELEYFIIQMIKKYLGKESNYEFKVLVDPVPDVKPLSDCSKSGFCNAFVIKYVIDWLAGRPFDGSNILRFIHMIESTYALPDGEPDIEYDFSPLGAGIGLGAGALIGGAVAGPAGLVIGGIGGGLIGGFAGGAIENGRY